jgi:hypothetical protein
MPEKDEVAEQLARAHREAEPTIERIVRLVADGDGEADAHEPVKLLEVNPATSPSGVLPIAFGSNPPDVPYPSVVVEVTPTEYQQIRDGQLALPHAWRLGATIYPRAAGEHAHVG